MPVGAVNNFIEILLKPGRNGMRTRFAVFGGALLLVLVLCVSGYFLTVSGDVSERTAAAAVYALIFLLACGIVALSVTVISACGLYRRREAKYLEDIVDGVIVIDKNWDIVLWNRAAQALSGWSADQAIGKPLKERLKLIKESDRSENYGFIETLFSRGLQQRMMNESVLVGKDDRATPINCGASPLFDEAGKVAGCIVVLRDATAEHELRKKDLEFHKMKDDFMFRTVHDLRNPTTIIRLVLDQLNDPELVARAPEVTASANLIKEANRRMAALVEDLLAVTKGEQVGVTLKKEEVRVDAIVTEVLQTVASALSPKGIFVTHAPPADLPSALADKEKLQDVFANLIDNAIKYNKDGGLIEVTYTVAAEYLRTDIRDTGIGMDPAAIPRLFTPYFRTAGRGIWGTGLGLYIVKTLVEKMGGRVEVRSQPDVGSTFSVFLPLAKKVG